MDSLFDQSPRGLAYKVISAKWAELCASFVPKVIGVSISVEYAETAIGQHNFTYGPNDTQATFGWAVSYGVVENTKNILISYKSDDGEIFSSHVVVVKDNGIEIDDTRKDYYADQHQMQIPTIESISGLLGYLEIHDTLIAIDAGDLEAQNPPKIKGT